MPTREHVIDVEQPVDVPAMAAFLNKSEHTIYVYARTGVIPAFKAGKEWRFLPSEVIAHLSRRRDPWVNAKKPRGRAAAAA